MATIALSKEEVTEVIKNSLCNSLGELASYGFQLVTSKMNYKKYRYDGACYEDVIIKALLHGEEFVVVDVEGDEEEHSFTLDSAIKTFETCNDKTFITAVLNYINETDDATDGDIVLQTLLFGEVMYG